MPANESLPILAIGFSVFFGALRMNANKFVPFLVGLGYFMILAGCIVFALEASTVVRIIIGAGVVALAGIAFELGREAAKSIHVADHIVLWERNAINWDEGAGRGNTRLMLPNGAMMSLPLRRMPARFTPVIQSTHDALLSGVDMTLTIRAEGLQVDNAQLNEWRPVLEDISRAVQYTGIIDKPVYPGGLKSGPDGIIQITFPTVGDYTVEYNIEGASSKGYSFAKRGFFIVHIYHDQQVTTPTASSIAS